MSDTLSTDGRSHKVTGPDLDARREKILAMFKGGMSIREIAASLGLKYTTVNKDIFWLRHNAPDYPMDRGRNAGGFAVVCWHKPSFDGLGPKIPHAIWRHKSGRPWTMGDDAKIANARMLEAFRG